MKSFVNKYINSIGFFFSYDDDLLLPRVDGARIIDFEDDLKEALTNTSDPDNIDSIKQWLTALVHSTSVDHVEEGIDILRTIHYFEGERWIIIKTAVIRCPLTVKEEHYYLAVGFYRSGHYLVSLQMIKISLRMDRGWRQAVFLKTLIERRLERDAIKLASATGFSVGLVAFGMLFALNRLKKYDF